MTKDNPDSPVCPVGESSCSYLEEVAELSQMVHTDGLTGLFNYRHFCHAMEQEMARTRRQGQPTSLVMLDLDHFKQINDAWGHEAGNQVLRTLAGVIREQLRQMDIACRYGGEEFALILSATPLPRAITVARRLRETIALCEIEVPATRLRVTASMGVNVYMQRDNLTLSRFVEETDALLYRAKHAGRNRVVHPDLERIRPPGQVASEEKQALLGGDDQNESE